MTPDLQPTQRIPTFPEQPNADEHAFEHERRGGPDVLGFVGRLAGLVLLLLGGMIAAALLLTPTRQSLLILGSDARPDEIRLGVVGRTDTLLLVVADRAAPRLAMVSIPRDLWVAIPTHGSERVNAAFELGGGQTAKQTVSNLLGQPVDRYTLVGLQGVRDIVDAVGGVDITVTLAIHDDSYPTDDYGYQTVDIPAGRQHMDGDIALKYARSRHQDSDFGRIARQQQVLAALRSALMNPLNWPRIPAVAMAVRQSIQTDLSFLDAIAMSAAMLRQPGDPDRLVIDASLVTPVVGQDGAALLDPKPELKPAVARFVGGSAFSASVEILNGAGVPGLAARTADRLTQHGFVVTGVGDAPRAQPQTTIVSRTGARASAEQVATTLGVPASRIAESASLGTSDVQVILGPDVR